MSSFPWRTALRIAWRESRASTAKFTFVALAIAVGVGSLGGVRGFSKAFRDILFRDARQLLAADLSIRVFELPTRDQEALFDDWARRGVRRTWITETLSMLAAAGNPDPLLVGVKAVDPQVYPFYGQLRLNPPGRLADRLTDEVMVVSEDLLVRMNLKVGDHASLGTQEFTIGGVVTAEPDRMAGSMNIGPRVMITRGGMRQTGLLLPGSRAAQRHLFLLSPAVPLDTAKAELRKVFPSGLIADFRESHPLVTGGLERATTFLSLVSLIAMIVGALGVATAMHSHIQQKLDSIAVMKALGGRSRQIIRVYLMQALLLTAAGGAAGLLLSLGVQRVFPWLIQTYFPNLPPLPLQVLPAVEGIGVALLTTLLFTLPPLLSIRQIRPNLILRREMEEARPPWRERWRQGRSALAVGAVIVAGIGAIATWMASGAAENAAKVGAWFAGGLVVSLLLLGALSWLLLRGLRRAAAARFARWPATLRHGIANLYRPGNHAQAALVSLSIGVMFTLTIYLVQHSVLRQVMASAPPGMPNVFLLNITAADKAAVEAFYRGQPGVDPKIEITPSVGARLVSINGESMEPRVKDGPARRFRQARQVGFGDRIPDNTEIIAGAWWPPGVTGEARVSVSQDAAKTLNLTPGMRLEFTATGKKIPAVVAAIHKTESMRAGSGVEFIFSAGALEGVPVLYFGGLRVKPPEIARLQRESYRRFPAITVINVADIIERVQEVVDQIALIVRFISAFAILAGIIILASSVAGTRFRRVREVVILKTLGATRRRAAAIFSVEFLLLGLVAGVMGSLLATGFSSLLLKKLLRAEFHFDIVPNLVAIAATAVIANVAGWLASFRILNQKPLEALRNE